jgi:hypothetical protein
MRGRNHSGSLLYNVNIAYKGEYAAMLERGYDCRSEAATGGPMSAVAVLHSSHSRLTATGHEYALATTGQSPSISLPKCLPEAFHSPARRRTPMRLVADYRVATATAVAAISVPLLRLSSWFARGL